jgi:hypothetical protein
MKLIFKDSVTSILRYGRATSQYNQGFPLFSWSSLFAFAQITIYSHPK